MKINKIILIGLFLIHNCQASSKSFFRPRDVSTDSALELSLVNYHRYHSPSGGRFSFYVKPFFMKSTNNKDLARYFLPNTNTCVTLDESGHGNLDPLWFNLISPDGSFYTSTLSLAPERRVAGALFTLYAYITPAMWLGINTAAIEVTNNAHLCEANRTQEGTIPGFENAYQAFNNPAWCAGKISACNLKIGGLDDIQFKLGYDICRNDTGHTTLYAVATAPTGKRPNATYLFEPLVGSKNGSFGAGLNAEVGLCDFRDKSCAFIIDLKYRYIFGAIERRSFDLCNNGDWSRYLLVVTQDQLLDSQPGINLLTIPAHVTPRSIIDLWTAINIPVCDFNIEIGYDFWWRQAEKICKKCPIAAGYGIQTLALCSNISSASTATICQAAQGGNATVTDTTFTAITDTDVNLNSAAHPQAHSQKLYLDLGYTFNDICSTPIIALAASYEFKAKNALTQWAIWLTAGFSY